jgi:hypothetical protein
MYQLEEVRRVETMFGLKEGLLCGFRFFDDFDRILLSCGQIGNITMRMNAEYLV